MDPANRIVRHTVPGNQQKPDIPAGRVDGGGNAAALIPITAFERSQIDDR